MNSPDSVRNGSSNGDGTSKLSGESARDSTGSPTTTPQQQEDTEQDFHDLNLLGAVQDRQTWNRSQRAMEQAAQKQMELSNRLMASTMGIEEGNPVPEEDDSVNWRSPTVTNHYYPQQQNGVGKLAKAALIAGAILGAGGIGAAAMLGWEALQKPPESTQPIDTDTDSQVMIEAA